MPPRPDWAPGDSGVRRVFRLSFNRGCCRPAPVRKATLHTYLCARCCSGWHSDRASDNLPARRPDRFLRMN